MPRIPDAALECVAYLYPDASSANNGKRAGGTGFLLGAGEVGEDGEREWVFGDAPVHLYAVTARHVVLGASPRVPGAPVIRIHRRDGTPHVITKRVEDWRFHPEGDDLAICPLGLSGDHAPALYLQPRDLVDEAALRAHNFGIGNTVYVVGRFIGHDGVQRNRPTVRFGSIAMMGEPVLNTATKRKQESILIDTRMRGGYSGSPVFVIQYAYERPHAANEPPKVVNMLLGVLWGLLYEPTPVRNKSTRVRPLPDFIVEQNAGLAGVVPAWKVNELLELHESTLHREPGDT